MVVADERPVCRREAWRRAHLRQLQCMVEDALGVAAPTPICPVVVGSARRALRISELLWREGYHVPAIRAPTVPEGTSRLRISLSAGHSVAEVQGMLRALQAGLRAVPEAAKL